VVRYRRGGAAAFNQIKYAIGHAEMIASLESHRGTKFGHKFGNATGEKNASRSCNTPFPPIVSRRPYDCGDPSRRPFCIIGEMRPRSGESVRLNFPIPGIVRHVMSCFGRRFGFASKKSVNPADPKQLSRAITNFARALDFLCNVSGLNADWLARFRHGDTPCCAGGSALGLSATDAYGQSLGR
jgi:hypothetical protein